MFANQRAQDILIGAIFGIILGLMSGLWASVFDHLFLENASKTILYGYFISYSIGLIAVGVILYMYAKRFGKQKN